MKQGYQTISSLKNECTSFAKEVARLDFSELGDDFLREEFKSEKTETQLAAMVSEVIFRLKGIRIFESQLITAAALFKGNIAELPTGEGKTLAAVVAAVLFAKAGRAVHILVFNDYLAQRDGTDNKEIFDFCGISSGYVTEDMPLDMRKEAYNRQILYICAREAGYDCIRNFTADSPQKLIGGEFNVAIVDEADSILIDEASIPLVLAGKAEKGEANEPEITKIVSSLDEEDFEISEQDRQIWLNDKGIQKVENALLIDDLYSDENFNLLSDINTALEACYILKKDKDYIVRNGKIAVIDESTGRVAASRKFPNALHRFVEAKEGITDNIYTKIYCTMTIGAFMSQYKTLAGMTGTAATSADEFESTYELRTVVVEPHTPCIRNDLADEFFETNNERDQAVINEIISANSKGQPVLIGTSSVEESEKLSALLNENNISHNVLNARNDRLEAEIIAQAGKPYSVTVSTNMAGRGVDIKLGGSDEKEKEKVCEVGGLYVISSSINSSRRIDNQLKGRAGRQGDPGMSKFFISLEDETIAPFFDDELLSRKKMTAKDKFALVRSAQKTLEGNEAEARYTLKKYSYIIEYQRKVLSDYRLKILRDEEVPNILQTEDFDKYLELEQAVGKEAVELAEKQLVLYYINQHFATYLEAMEDYKSGVHLTIVAGKNPFDEFNRTAISAFEEMNQDIRFDVLEKIREVKITEKGIDMSEYGLDGATGTWTYMVDDSAGQFNHLPAIMNMVSKKIKESIPLGQKLENFFNKFKRN